MDRQEYVYMIVDMCGDVMRIHRTEASAQREIDSNHIYDNCWIERIELDD